MFCPVPILFLLPSVTENVLICSDNKDVAVIWRIPELNVTRICGKTQMEKGASAAFVSCDVPLQAAKIFYIAPKCNQNVKAYRAG